MNKLTFSLLALGAAVAAVAAPTNALTDSVSATGNQSWEGALGLLFDVGSTDVLVTRLAVFDSGGDGFQAGTTMQVGIFNRDNQTLVGTSAILTGSAGTLIDARRFVDVAGIHLVAGGHYALVAVGFNSLDQNFNTGFTNGGSAATDNGGSALHFVGSSRYDNESGVFKYPGIVDSGPAIRYGSANMTFQAVPEPFTVGLGIAAAGLFIRRKRMSRASA